MREGAKREGGVRMEYAQGRRREGSVRMSMCEGAKGGRNAEIDKRQEH